MGVAEADRRWSFKCKTLDEMTYYYYSIARIHYPPNDNCNMNTARASDDYR